MADDESRNDQETSSPKDEKETEAHPKEALPTHNTHELLKKAGVAASAAEISTSTTGESVSIADEATTETPSFGSKKDSPFKMISEDDTPPDLPVAEVAKEKKGIPALTYEEYSMLREAVRIAQREVIVLQSKVDNLEVCVERLLREMHKNNA